MSFWQRYRGLPHYLAGLAFLVCLHRHLLSSKYALHWDAVDFLLPVMHWFQSAVNAGESPAWMPHLAGGFPVGRELQFGFMGPLHPIMSMAFPGSTQAVSVLLLLLYTTGYSAVWGIARMMRIDPWPATWVALWVCASGFWIGNASHIPIMTAVTFTLVITLGLFGFGDNRRWAPIAVAMGWLLAINGCYPTTLFFGGVMIGLTALLLIAARRLSLRGFCQFLGASAIGIAAGLPTLFAAATWFRNTPHGNDMPIDEVMRMSTAPEAFKTFFMPLIRIEDCKWVGATDITLDRFHLTFAAILLLPIALIRLRRWRGAAWVCAVFVLIGVDATLGKNGFLRYWLAEQFALARLNHCMPADHAWLIPVALAFGLGHLLQSEWRTRLAGRPWRMIAVSALLAFDVGWVITANNRQLVANHAWPPWHPKPAPQFQVVWEPHEQVELDAGRACTPDLLARADNTPAIPDHMLPWGFVSAGVRKYESDFRAKRLDWICGEGKLRDTATTQSVPYRLIRYAPTEVRIVVGAEAPRDLVWNDVDDGWWEITANGENARAPYSPSGLRRFMLPDGEIDVCMTYRPLIPIWTGWAGSALCLLISLVWVVRRRASAKGPAAVSDMTPVLNSIAPGPAV